MKKLAIPFTFDAVHGRVQELDECEEVKASVKTILMSNVHERILRPTFGSHLQDYVFSQMEYTTLEMLKKEVLDTLHRQEPRIFDIQVVFQHQEGEAGTLLIYVSYRIHLGGNVESMSLRMDHEGVRL